MSTVIVTGVLGAETFPKESVTVAATDQSPSASAPRSHDDTVDDAVNVHDTDTPLRVAVTVTVIPVVTPGTEIVGVLSAVMLSVDDAPVSDAAVKSDEEGAAGSEVLMVTVSAGPEDDVLPAGSVVVAVTDQSPSASVPRSQPVATPAT